MSHITRILFFLLVILSVSERSGFAQNKTVDSLKIILQKPMHDTSRCILLNLLIDNLDAKDMLKYNEEYSTFSLKKMQSSSPTDKVYLIYKAHYANSILNFGYKYRIMGESEKALKYNLEALKIFTELGENKGIATVYNNLGVCYDQIGDIKKALEYYNLSLKIREGLGDKKDLSYSYNNLAIVYSNQGNIPLALHCFEKSLKLREEIGYTKGVAQSLSNIAGIYSDNHEYKKALEYYNKGLQLRQKINDKQGVALSYNSLGRAAFKEGHHEKAKEYFESALKINEEIEDRKGITNSLNSLISIHRKLHNFDVAIKYAEKNLAICEKAHDKSGMASTLQNLGSIYGVQSKMNKAIECYSRGLALSKEIGYPEKIALLSFQLYTVQKYIKNYKVALENYELHIKMRDSTNNETTRKASIKSQLKYEYEKQAAADSVAHAKESEIKNVELEKQKVEIAAKKNQQYALFGGLGLVIIFAVFMFNRFKITQKQKVIIEHQKEIVEEQKKIVEEKQKEVLDSIHYARRIQIAHLPNELYINKSLNKLKNSD